MRIQLSLYRSRVIEPMNRTERILDLTEELARLSEVIREQSEGLSAITDRAAAEAFIRSASVTNAAAVRHRANDVTTALHEELKFVTSRSVMDIPEIASSELPDAVRSIRSSLRALRGHLRRLDTVYDALEEGTLVEQQKGLLLRLERLSGSFSGGLKALEEAARSVDAAPKRVFTIRKTTQLSDAAVYVLELHAPSHGTETVTVSALDKFNLVFNATTRRVAWEAGAFVEFRIPDGDLRDIASLRMQFVSRTPA